MEMTYTLPDKGLSTTISGHNHLNDIHNRYRIKDVVERNLKFLLVSIEAIVSALRLPPVIRETAALFGRKIVNAQTGVSIDGVATVLVYAACIVHKIPRTIDDVSKAAGVSELEIYGAYRALEKLLDLKPIPTPLFGEGKVREVASWILERDVFTKQQLYDAFPEVKEYKLLAIASVVKNEHGYIPIRVGGTRSGKMKYPTVFARYPYIWENWCKANNRGKEKNVGVYSPYVLGEALRLLYDMNMFDPSVYPDKTVWEKVYGQERKQLQLKQIEKEEEFGRRLAERCPESIRFVPYAEDKHIPPHIRSIKRTKKGHIFIPRIRIGGWRWHMLAAFSASRDFIGAPHDINKAVRECIELTKQHSQELNQKQKKQKRLVSLKPVRNKLLSSIAVEPSVAVSNNNLKPEIHAAGEDARKVQSDLFKWEM